MAKKATSSALTLIKQDHSEVKACKEQLLSSGVPRGYEESAIEKAGLLTESPSKRFTSSFQLPGA